MSTGIGIGLGVVFIIAGVITLLAASSPPNSTLGYKNPFRRGKIQWKIGNKCMGAFMIFGGAVYLMIYIVLKQTSFEENTYSKYMYIGIISYIVLSMIITEVYIYIKTRK